MVEVVVVVVVVVHHCCCCIHSIPVMTVSIVFYFIKKTKNIPGARDTSASRAPVHIHRHHRRRLSRDDGGCGSWSL